MVVALRRELGAKCVTCSYHDKFTPFHNQMNVIYKIYVKYLLTIYCYNTKCARKIDSYKIFNVQDVFKTFKNVIWGRKVNI